MKVFMQKPHLSNTNHANFFAICSSKIAFTVNATVTLCVQIVEYARIFKGTADDSSSPWGEGRVEGLKFMDGGHSYNFDKLKI
jgi:hypothetical protein